MLALGSNKVTNLDDMKIGVTWYNADQGIQGTLPYSTYGFVMAFQATNSNYIQIAIPFVVEDEPKYRIHCNGKWYSWEFLTDLKKYEKSALTIANGVGTVQNGLNSLEKRGTTKTLSLQIKINSTISEGALIATAPSDYRPTNVGMCMSTDPYSNTARLFQITNNGQLRVYGGGLAANQNYFIYMAYI